MKLWYCAFCGRYHLLKKRKQFPSRPSGVRRCDGKDGICNKGIIFVEQLTKTQK